MKKLHIAENALKWSLLGLTVLMILTYFMPTAKSVAPTPGLPDVFLNYSTCGEYQTFYDVILIFPIMSIVLLLVSNRNARPFAWAFYGFYIIIYFIITDRIKTVSSSWYEHVFCCGYYTFWITAILSILVIAASITLNVIIAHKSKLESVTDDKHHAEA